MLKLYHRKLCLLVITLPETNIGPENGWLEDYFPYWEGKNISGAMSVFGGLHNGANRFRLPLTLINSSEASAKAKTCTAGRTIAMAGPKTSHHLVLNASTSYKTASITLYNSNIYMIYYTYKCVCHATSLTNVGAHVETSRCCFASAIM